MSGLTIDRLEVGQDLPSISLPITLQRLVMEAGANRDFSLIHHDVDVARATGAPDAYMNTFFILGMFERLLREWMGYHGVLKKISSLSMSRFNCVGDVVTFTGSVNKLDANTAMVTVDLRSETAAGETVTAQAVVQLPGQIAQD